MSATIAVLGSLNADLVMRTARFAQPGETLLAGPFATFPGGKGANQAVGVARLGARARMIGAVGSDAHGIELLAALAHENVDVAHVAVLERATTGIAAIAVDARGENQILVAPGANAQLGREHVDPARDAIATSDALLAQLETPLCAVARGAHLARELGVRFFLNAAPARELGDEVLRMVDVLIVNLGEARALAGSGEPIELAQRLVQRGPAMVAITLGADGAMAVARGGETSAQRGFAVDVVDSTAAGDAFAAAFVVGMVRRDSPRDALRAACAAGALACTAAGALTSMPSAARVAELMRRGER